MTSLCARRRSVGPRRSSVQAGRLREDNVSPSPAREIKRERARARRKTAGRKKTEAAEGEEARMRSECQSEGRLLSGLTSVRPRENPRRGYLGLSAFLFFPPPRGSLSEIFYVRPMQLVEYSFQEFVPSNLRRSFVSSRRVLARLLPRSLFQLLNAPTDVTFMRE